MIALKCPVCGAPLPPPVRKGGRPRKFCSMRCAQRASYEYGKARGYKKPKDKRLFCVVCGDTFYSERSDRQCCGITCSNILSALRRGVKLSKKSLARLEAKNAKSRAAEACRETAPITVEERDGIRIETRGQRCVGFFAANKLGC